MSVIILWGLGIVAEKTRQRGQQHIYLLVTLLLCGLFVAAAVRFYQLDRHTISHPEIYVAISIDLPDFVHHPPKMKSFQEVFDFMFYEPHLPGYHLFMLAWNRVFGTSVFAMRTPSALVGLLAVLVVFAYVRRSSSLGTAVLASWLLALHGHHVFWSQNMRPWVFVAFLALVTSWLMVLIEKRWRLTLAICYALVVACGLWIEYYFWLIFAAQILWVLIRGADRREMPALVGAQTLALILAMPVFMYIRYQLGRPSHIDDHFWPHAVDTLQFGNLFAVFFGASQVAVDNPIAFISMTVAGGGLLFAGLIASTDTDHANTDPITHSQNEQKKNRFPVYLLFAAAIAELLFVEVFFSPNPLVQHGTLFFAIVSAPWVLIACWFAARKTWPIYTALLKYIRQIPVIGTLCSDSVAIQLFVPYIMLGVLCFAKPLISSYALVSFLPFVLILIARGIMRLDRLRAVTVMTVICVFAFSTYVSRNARAGGPDFKQLAARLIPHIQEGDVILVRSSYWVEPIHYYLKPGQFNVKLAPGFVGRPRTEPQPAFPLPDRVWIVEFGETEFREPRINEILTKTKLPELRFDQSMDISMYRGAAVLYEHR